MGLHCIMPHTSLTDAQVAARYGVHRSTPRRWSKTDPDFPKPITLSPGCTRWNCSDLEVWEASKRGDAE